MKRFAFLALCAVATVIVGCDSGQPKSEDSGGKPVVQNSGTGQTSSTTSGEAPGTGQTTTGQTEQPTQPGNTNVTPEQGNKRPDPGQSRPEIPDIKKPDGVDQGATGWTKATIKPTELASKIASGISGVKGAYGEASIIFQNAGGNGSMVANIWIKDNKVYRIDLPDITGSPSVGNVNSDGKLKHAAFKGHSSKPVPASTKSWMSQGGDEAKWIQQFPSMIFRGIFDSNDPWGGFVKIFGDPKNGYELQAQQRDMPWKGKTIRNYRFLVTRTAASAKKKGPLEMEFVFDGQRFLPVTVRLDSADGDGKLLRANWSGKWSFNRKFGVKELSGEAK